MVSCEKGIISCIHSSSKIIDPKTYPSFLFHPPSKMESRPSGNKDYHSDSGFSSEDSDNFEDARNYMDSDGAVAPPEKATILGSNIDFDNNERVEFGQNGDDENTELCPAYMEQYDEHVRGFFGLNYMTGQTRLSKNYHVSQPSVNNSTGAYYIPRPYRPYRFSGKPLVEHSFLDPDVYVYNEENTPDFAPETQAEIDEIKSIPGTLWSSSEKDVFFSCLARYSIHRLDAFLPHLPYKTMAEIEAYYDLLKNSLEGMKRVQNYNAYLYGEAKHRLRTKYAMRVWEQGIRYWRIPIAHEVDEEWVQFEERQSQLLARRDSRMAQGVSPKRADIMAKYTGVDVDNESLNLVNVHALNQLSQIYNANNITPTLEGQESPKIGLWPLVFLDELVKTRVRDMFIAILVGKGTNGVNTGPESDIEMENESGPSPALKETIVTQHDVWKAASDLRLFETQKSGFKSRYNDGKTPLLATYWARVAPSLKLSLDGSEQELGQESESEMEIESVQGPILPLESEYTNSDFFLRDIKPETAEIELPDELVAVTMPEASASEDELSDFSSSDESSSNTQSWNLAAPWETHASNLMVNDSSDTEAETEKNGNSTGKLGKKLLSFTDLETSETFTRKRTIQDVKIEEYLNEDVDEYIEWRDRKMTHAYLRDLKASAGLPVEKQNLREPRRNCISRSMVHRAWVKHFASY